MYKNLIILAVLLFSTQAMAEDRALAQMRSENRVALVIGNNTYQRPLTRLNNTINDAQAIRNILANRGFDVIYRENLSHRAFDAVLEEFYQKLRYGGVGLLYFSGHGLEFNGQNYLIPTDAKIGAKSDTQYEAVALNKITDRIQKVGNRLNIVILDACRNDPFAKAYGVGGLAKTEPPIGLLVSYATGAGQVSSDGRVGGNGLFTQYLIENMKKPLSIEEVFKKTRASVYDASGGTQFPALYNQIVKGDFYFTLPSVQTQSTQTTYVAPQPVQIQPQSTYIAPQPVVVQSAPVSSSNSLQWITPIKSVCEKGLFSKRGEIDEGGYCKSTWENAKEICKDSGGILPSKDILEQVITDCKKEYVNGINHCFLNKGFGNLFYYWSSDIVGDNVHVWFVAFRGSGGSNTSKKTSKHYVRCVRAGE